ncbi:MAG: hypothetical protein RJB38_1392 [Pseudomonadota bacterium]|jgi:hypothetical protein
MKKSRFVTWLGVFGIIGSAFGLFAGAIQLLSWWGLERAPDLAPVLTDQLREQFGVSMSLEEISSVLLRHGVSTTGASVAGVIMGWGLLLRRSWARSGAIFLLVILTLGMGVSAFTSPAGVSSLLYWVALAFTGLAVFVHGGIILKLRSLEIRREFGNEGPELASQPVDANTLKSP